MDAMTIRAVLFDVDGTLYRQAPLRRAMALELMTRSLVNPVQAWPRMRALSAYRKAQEKLRAERAKGDLDARQIAAAVRASGLPLSEVVELIHDWMHVRPLRHLSRSRSDGLDALLDAVAKSGRRLGVLSDYPAQAKLDALGLAGRFDPILCAGDEDIGAFKPDPTGFQRACDAWGLSPAEVLMIGDRVEVDAVGAAAAGMPSVIVTDRAPSSVLPPGCTVVPALADAWRVISRE